MITRALVETDGSRRLEPEMQAVYDELGQRHVPVELFTQKRLQRRQLALTNQTLVVGYVDTVLLALRLLGIQPPPTHDYPDVLQPFFHRRIWESTIRQLVSEVYAGNGPVFAKPKDRKKRFTGQVFAYPDDLNAVVGVPSKTPIFCAEVVDWVSEYRVFVTHGQIVGIRHYDGDPTVLLDEQIAAEVVRLLEQAKQSTAAYAVDLGVMRDGQTALIEWNDGFSLGSYGVDQAIYTDLLITRWCALTGCETVNS